MKYIHINEYRSRETGDTFYILEDIPHGLTPISDELYNTLMEHQKVFWSMQTYLQDIVDERAEAADDLIQQFKTLREAAGGTKPRH